MIATGTKRPRNLDVGRSAAILYGDWGTSKAYVVGLAFAVAGGYASFPLIVAMCLLTALVGVNYMTICKHYPDGGGVYASVRHRSEIISIIGAFLLIADYIVTAALSALSAFLYLGWPHPEWFAAIAIALIGGLNFFGAKHSAGLAFIVSIPTVVVVFLLSAFCIPHLGTAIHNIQPLHGGFFQNWNSFVSIVLALSGVEAIANATGLMKLDPGSDDAKPSVIKTSTPAIVWVMLEVCVFTALLGLAMNALPGLHQVAVPGADNDVNAPGAEGVRDYMLRYMAQIFVGGSLGSVAGTIAGAAVSIVFGVLLLSAVNTALMDIISVTFLMSRDGEMPPVFSKLNKFGVPTAGMIFAAVVPVGLVLCVGDLSGLADLYAVGVVGAIATNLGASSTDKNLALTKWERRLMFFTFLLMLSIEISLFVEKPKARLFTLALLATGLILRGLAAERAQRKKLAEAATVGASHPAAASLTATLLGVNTGAASGEPMLCSVRGIGPTLDFAIDDAKKSDSPLYLLFVREQPALAPEDRKRKWMDDPEAREIFTYAAERADGHTILPCYAVSDSVADTIVDIAATVGTSRVILGAPKRNSLVNFLRGNLIRQVARILPDEIHLLVYA
jgi:amino acid transporter/nucleotide-binding universal stress UspA family protein